MLRWAELEQKSGLLVPFYQRYVSYSTQVTWTQERECGSKTGFTNFTFDSSVGTSTKKENVYLVQKKTHEYIGLPRERMRRDGSAQHGICVNMMLLTVVLLHAYTITRILVLLCTSYTPGAVFQG